MKNDRALQAHYADRSHMSLMRELDEEKKARETAEKIVGEYQRAFSFLNAQDWFQNQRHLLAKHLQD